MTSPDPTATAPATLGIIGAGRIGRAIAVLGRRAGIEVRVAASRPPEQLRADVEAAAPGASAVSVVDAARADIVVLAIPLGRHRQLPPEALAGALVVDAMNYWWELDGARPEFDDPLTSTSETVQAHLAGSRVVKAFGHVSAYALEELARDAGDPERIAMAIAGDDDRDVAAVGALADALGFDPLPAGPLAEGRRFEPGTEVFGADAGVTEAREMLERFWDSQRGRVVARARALSPERGAGGAE
ncbi:NADPH-dependent F420 reductase [Demequina muriae]|uniref:NAD(P)-binding domain-containing protein n=1 Tax=Demequina muriae TaxID=3051664 RepID=A0ABT8GIX1_9MICO|nr:NAD(P)-binding domain-containing protein [Demequina sp. EGI L300058]MDN4481372.1 NAD(P)-binding domain-containing protein [Demequina sp. EGI L300058]